MFYALKMGLSKRYYYYYIERAYKKLSKEYGECIAVDMIDILKTCYFGDINLYNRYHLYELEEENKIINEKKILKRILNKNKLPTKKRGRL